MPALKNARHERFAQELAKGKSATDAMKAVGYSDPRNSTRLTKNHEIAARVAELTAKASEKAIDAVAVTKERVLSELAKIGFSDIRKVFTENGTAIRPIGEWDDDIAGAVASVKVVSRPAGKDEDGNQTVEYVHEFKAWDKRAALVDLGKHLGMFRDERDSGGSVNIQININGKDAGIL